MCVYVPTHACVCVMYVRMGGGKEMKQESERKNIKGNSKEKVSEDSCLIPEA